MRILSKVGIQSLWGIIIVLFVLSSCVPMKKQIYLQVEDADSTQSQYVNDNTPSYTLQPGNNLYMQVVSVDREVTAFFNAGMGTSGNIYYDAAVYLNSYSVNDSGFVELPFIGYLDVKGLTLKKAKEKVQQEVDTYVKKTMVVLKLVNYNVSVVGEVKRPGQFKIYQDHITIFEVLSLAGDMTTFAKRGEVILVRKTEKGSKMHKINFLEDKILESEFYYIMPDDIVYVPPVRGRNFAFTAFPYTLVISTISLTIALFALLN